MDKQLDEGQRENAEVADDPVRFAEWVNRYILSATTPADDLQLCPSGEQCETLSITADERAACLREFAIMRALGACMFVARNLRPSFYKTFKASICASTA